VPTGALVDAKRCARHFSQETAMRRRSMIHLLGTCSALALLPLPATAHPTWEGLRRARRHLPALAQRTVPPLPPGRPTEAEAGARDATMPAAHEGKGSHDPAPANLADASQRP
jgi:hypothetical protein